MEFRNANTKRERHAENMTDEKKACNTSVRLGLLG